MRRKDRIAEQEVSQDDSRDGYHQSAEGKGYTPVRSGQLRERIRTRERPDRNEVSDDARFLSPVVQEKARWLDMGCWLGVRPKSKSNRCCRARGCAEHGAAEPDQHEAM